MSKVLFSCLLLSIASFSYAQNKSLGVGVATPNPNAALHVESPTGNQGAIMPRLTTAQRNAMSAILGATDAGLLLYDNNEKVLYIWNGNAWESSAKIRYPQVDTISTLPPNGNALRIVYNGTDVGNFGVAHFENMNPNSGFSAIFGRTNSATNGAADFMVSNPANTNDAVGATTNALNGRAGAFNLNNAGSRNHALYAQSNGDSTGSAVHGNNIGNGFGVFGKSAGTKFASAAVYGEHIGTGDAAGAFRINNPANTYSALYGETNGSGPAIFGNQLGLGRAGQFQIGNATNTNAALRGFTSGLGNAGFFTINNVANDSSALYITTNGTGNAITANAPIQATQFIGDGSLLTNVGGGGFTLPRVDSISNATGTTDIFALKYNNAESKRVLRVENLNRSNGSSAVSISNNGSGLGLYVQNSNDSSAVSSVFVTNNSNNINANPGPVSIYGESTGTAGAAGSFRVFNKSNNKAAVYAETAGTGNSVFARHSGADGHAGYFWVADTTNFSNPVRAQTDGTGSAVRLEVTNPNNTSAALQINHYGLGQAINAVKTNDGGVANFQITDPNNNNNVLDLSTSGNGYALSATTSGGQRAAYFSANNPLSTGPAVSINSLALVDALEVYGYGQGRAATFMADSAAEAVQVRTDGPNTRGATFLVNNPSNAQPVIYSQSIGTGPAIELSQFNNGAALSITQGGLRYNVLEPASPGAIFDRSTIYKLTQSGSYTINWPVNLGDAFYVYNDSGDSVFIHGNEVVFGFSALFVYMGSSWVKF